MEGRTDSGGSSHRPELNQQLRRVGQSTDRQTEERWLNERQVNRLWATGGQMEEGEIGKRNYQ